MNNAEIAWMVCGGIAVALTAGFVVTLLPEVRRYWTKKMGPRRSH
jgi:hypothetical protein